MGIGLPPEQDDALFVLLQSMGYGPNIPLWQYQKHKRKLQQFESTKKRKEVE